MTEAQLNTDIARLVAIYKSQQHDPRVQHTPAMAKAREADEIEAMAIVVRIAASTIGCLHRIADALETANKPIDLALGVAGNG